MRRVEESILTRDYRKHIQVGAPLLLEPLRTRGWASWERLLFHQAKSRSRYLQKGLEQKGCTLP